ncbi:hypothetical protein AB0L42_19730 [Streptomyces sp. NPDC052287]|uniref:hypothetical protein n=1 Tax=unclassified Streptomyces TaxID=2593676 RepID=UPI00143E2F02|nr:hypothetical protein HEP85_21640 [Streptomyces sp. RPA4-2]
MSTETRRLTSGLSTASHTRAALPALQQSRTTTIRSASLLARILSTLVNGAAPSNPAVPPRTTSASRICNHSSSPALGTAPCPAK